MYILGDIGNSETKFFLISLNDKIIKKLTILTKDINLTKLDKLFFNSKIDYKNIKKILFCENIRSLLFYALNKTFHIFAYILIFSKSLLSTIAVIAGSSPEAKGQVSSANKRHSDSKSTIISWM